MKTKYNVVDESACLSVIKSAAKYLKILEQNIEHFENKTIPKHNITMNNFKYIFTSKSTEY